MVAFDMAVEEVLRKEGVFSDNKHDSGGKTKYGITESVAREDGYGSDMRDLSIDRAISIYKRNYWDTLSLDDISRISYPIALELFDSCVNTGIGTSTKWLQRCLNVLNNKQAYYQDLVVDGALGAKTLMALTAYSKLRGKLGEKVLLKLLNSLQGEFYVGLAEAREKDEEFMFGWAANRL
jgi:lysozyme family protein|tara:strand:- start:4361 stop:4900 length:540 start_codon:yes stop_codon:yes gene_type:complete